MIPYGKHHIEEDDIQAVVNVLKSGILTQGPAVEAFESAVAQYVGAKYAIAVSSGTAGLHLAAIAAGLGPGQKLITSPITFVASANAGSYVGADVVLSDVDSNTINLCPAALEDTLKAHPETRVIIPVHFAGLPCDMPAIKKVADQAGALVIEDAAHALGSTYPNGKRVGCCEHSAMTVFSFHPVKAIAAGEGGMITTNDEKLYRHLIRLRSHGINKLDDPLLNTSAAFTNDEQNPWYYEMQELGFHYRITDIQCALALSQMKKLDKFVTRRRALVEVYDAAFRDFKQMKPIQTMGRQLSAHHLYVARFDFESMGISRGNFMKKLRTKNIGTQVHYIPVDLHPYYKNKGADPARCPNAHAYYAQCLSLPLFFALTDEQQSLVLNTVQELVK